MNRLGFRRDAFRDAFARLATLPSVRQVTLMTHFANADLEGGTDEALARFQAAADGLAAARSLANSAATLLLPGTHGDAIRPGVMAAARTEGIGVLQRLPAVNAIAAGSGFGGLR